MKEIGASTTFTITATTSIDITTLDNILVAIYSDSKMPIIGSLVANPKYNAVELVNPYSIKMQVLGSQCASKLSGEVFIEIKAVKDNNEYLIEDNGNSVPTSTGINVINTALKKVL